jgi:di/tricarboxylate transporter
LSVEQIITLGVLVGVVGLLIWDRIRSDVVALAGAAVLMLSGAIRPVEVQSAFASPAIIALASLFVVAYAMELSGLLDSVIRGAARICRVTGASGLWGVILLCGGTSAFLNNSPIVVLASPVVRDVALSLHLSPQRFLIPLSYITVLGGCCTLIGTSTNLLVSDMARAAGEEPFSLFEITPVGVAVALSGALYLMLFSRRRLDRLAASAPEATEGRDPAAIVTAGVPGSEAGNAALFAPERPLKPVQALASLSVFIGVVTVAALGWAPIAATAFAGAVLLILMRVISADEAYNGLRPEILLLIAGMVVIGLALEQTGLAAAATNALVAAVEPLGPFAALVLLYGLTLFLTELLSNATVAVLLTPVAVALAESLGIAPRPFVVAVMIGASAAFATPFGYQTNVLVYKLGRYNYMDFVRLGLPLNIVTWIAAMIAIPMFFPFRPG